MNERFYVWGFGIFHFNVLILKIYFAIVCYKKNTIIIICSILSLTATECNCDLFFVQIQVQYNAN